MRIVRCSGFISDEQKRYIEEFILPMLPMYLHLNMSNDNSIGLNLPVLVRPEEVSDDTPAIANGDYLQFLVDLFRQFLISANITGDYDILRIAINGTLSNVKVEQSGIHTDHEYDHKQLLIALNDDYIGGGTIIYPNYPDKSDAYTIEYDKYEGVTFDSCYHSAKFPEKGFRIMVVYTYTLRENDEARS